MAKTKAPTQAELVERGRDLDIQEGRIAVRQADIALREREIYEALDWVEAEMPRELGRLLGMVITGLGLPGPYPGVYLLLRGETVVYVGRTSNITRRLGEHRDKLYSHALCIRVNSPDAQGELEAALVHALTPEYNEQTPRAHWINKAFADRRLTKQELAG